MSRTIDDVGANGRDTRELSSDTGRGGMSFGGVNIQDMVGKAREYAQSNPAKVLGGLSALVIGAGLLSRRGWNRR